MKTTSTREVRCQLCEWLGAEDKLLIAHNPFDAVDLIYGCPSCKSIGHFTEICDEPLCRSEAHIGSPTEDGYRRTCYRHVPA